MNLSKYFNKRTLRLKGELRIGKCKGSSTPSRIIINGKDLDVEIAKLAQAHDKGRSMRDSLPVLGYVEISIKYYRLAETGH